MRETGKALNGGVGHPSSSIPAGTKQIVIRENRIIILPGPYKDLIGADVPGIDTSDSSECGSSGSPVLNDQFEVLALHHKGRAEVRRARAATCPQRGRAFRRRPWVRTRWHGSLNEGARVSAIFRWLDRLALSEICNAGQSAWFFWRMECLVVLPGALGAGGGPLLRSRLPRAPSSKPRRSARRRGKGYLDLVPSGTSACRCRS